MSFNRNINYNYRPRQPAFDASFIHEDDVSTATNMIRKQLAPFSGGPRGKQPASRPRRGARRTYNEGKMESLHVARNAETMNAVSQE